MSDRLKRILFVVFFVLFTIGVAIAIYFIFFAPKAAPVPGAPEAPAGVGVLPGAGEAVPGVPTVPGAPGTLPSAGGVPGAALPGGAVLQTSLLRDGITQGVSPSSQKDGARFYNPDDGKFYRVTPDGVTKPMSDQTFPNLDTVTWGKSTDQAIMSFPDGSKIYYNFNTSKQTTLPQHWDGFNFAPNDASVVAKSEALDPGSRYLIVADPDGSNPRPIEPLGENSKKVFPDWTPNNQVIAYATVGDPQGFDRQEIILVGQNHENFKGLMVEGRGFEPSWSPSGQKLVYSVWNSASYYRPELWVSGGAPGNVNESRSKLDVVTWANKCAWADENTIYCAVPSSLPTGAALQPDLFNNIPDSFIRIDLTTGAKTQLGTPTGDLSVKNPVVTSDGQNIIFTDALTGKLYNFNIQ
jgi:Tol biopolymer transport system component